jgi:hypothetical protein
MKERIKAMLESDSGRNVVMLSRLHKEIQDQIAQEAGAFKRK